MSDVKRLTNYEVLTPTGWSDFDGVSVSYTKVLFKLEFKDGTTIQCTPGHLVMYPNGEYLEACHVMEGDIIYNEKEVISVHYCELDEEYPVLDLINVAKNNQYITNGIISHNCAFIEGSDDLWASSQQTLGTGGKAIILSTPNGTGNLFHKLWIRAEAGDGNFKGTKLPWFVHPDRDQEWRDRQDEELGPRLAAQECDADFSTSGNTVIHPELLTWYQQTHCQEPMAKRGFDGNLWVWELPDYTKNYIVTADVARGDSTDHSAFHVIEVEDCRQVAEYRGQLTTKDYGNLLVAVATEYNDALLVIENANVGWASIQVAIDRGYKNLYYTYKDNVFDPEAYLHKQYDLVNRKDAVAGFTMTQKIRPLAVSKLDLYMREKGCIVRSRRLIDELLVFVWKSSRAEAQHGYNDDLVMSWMQGLWVRDTALKLRQSGLDLNRTALAHINNSKNMTGFKATGNFNGDPWKIDDGKGSQEDISWLL